MEFKCKHCGKCHDVDFRYHTDDHKGKFMEMYQAATDKVSEECDCNKEKIISKIK